MLGEEMHPERYLISRKYYLPDSWKTTSHAEH